MATRKEKDSLGIIDVPEEHLWGAQTERSLRLFQIASHKMPEEVILALISIKEAAAKTNLALGILDQKKAEAILKAIEEVREKYIKTEFPLVVFQTGSGTQTNMNVNEVIANVANIQAGSLPGSKSPIHPNDDVNKSQSSNDTFPTAMHIAIAHAAETSLFPELLLFIEELKARAKEFHHLIKIGRTHMMDAVPIRLGDEFAAYAWQIESAYTSLKEKMKHIYPLALGGTAVGTGLNCPKDFKEKAVALLAETYALPFTNAEDLRAALSCHDPIADFSSGLKRLATALFKIANDIRLMGSGPRAGLNELSLPENEPGSSIMPGKVNPTQCEAMTQVVAQVLGNDSAISFAATQGQFELNTFKPVIIMNALSSIHLLADAMRCFRLHCLHTLKANEPVLEKYLKNSLMLVTALTKKIGYDLAAKIALKAHEENLTLKEATLSLSSLSEEEFDSLTDPKKMV